MSTATPAFNIAEPIPGYRTKERIGAGGCGEVWKAEAPGGIAKAIKIVFGYRDDERAARELAALNRIKECTHPFVLSLERIEMVDGHLVIVTELASANLKDLFEEYRRQGQPGIPRAELLDHLRDAADALDYLCRRHSLQHLDVKPENLLLVGGRIKVGDFGLVKDLQDVNCSAISGLTPVYAGPELFDGRPSVHSDQYSLAIVYQEMLTGTPPFEGRTTAQLAAQHLHSRPRLDRLPASDQAAIGRALAKDPAQRFPCCRALIDSLLEVTPNYRAPAAWTAAGNGGYYAPPAASTKTEVLSAGALLSVPPLATTPRNQASLSTELVPAVRELEPLELNPDEMQYRPTVVIGIGGLAARTLQALQARLVNEFGDLHAVPAVQLLLFDTDVETLKAVTEGDAPTTLAENAAILLPLRPPADYRCESNQHLQWLSRRWIYNIPRSLQTQGLRPLGRLALVDHCQRVTERIERALRAAVDEAGIARSAERTGLPFRAAPPRVFLVSSISGGTGGGMVLDVAYLVRKALRDLGLSDEGLCGILAHCSGRNPQGRELAVANAYAFLGELYHYSNARQAYPGDAACGLPPFSAEDAPFNHTYVVHLGEELEQAELLAAAGKLARYVYASALTPEGVFVDRCRQQSADELASADPRVRTFERCQLGFSFDNAPAAAVDELCEALLQRWRGMERKHPEPLPTSLADPGTLLGSQFAEDRSALHLRGEVVAQAKAVGLDGADIVRQLDATMVREMGDNPETYLLTVVGQVVSSFHAGRGTREPPPGKVMVASLDTLIRVQETDGGQRVCMESLLEKQLAEMAAQQGATLRQWILKQVVTPGQRVEHAQHAADYLGEYLRGIGREASELLQARRVELGAIRQSLLDDQRPKHEWLRPRGFAWNRKLVADGRLARYFQLSIEELTLNGVCRLVRLILAQVAGVNDKLRNLAADLNRLAQAFQRHAEGNDATAAAPAGKDAAYKASETIRARRAELLAEMEHDLEEDLGRMATTEGFDAERLLGRMRRLAHAAILRTLKQAAVLEISTTAKDGGESVFSLAAGLQTAQARLMQCGGARRLLLVAPEDLAPEQLVAMVRREAGAAPTLLAIPSEGVLLNYEVQDLALRRVAAAVLDGRQPYVDLASRLHTRIDVPWATL